MISFDRRNLLTLLALAPFAGPGLATAQSAPIVAPMLIRQRRAVIAVQFGDAGPYAFLIDTGGFTSLIEEDLAKHLQLRSLGAIRMKGIGGIDNMTLFSASQVVFGGAVRQRDVVFGGMRGGRFGQDIRGALAAGLFTAIDSDLDFDALEWRLYPAGRSNHDGFVRLPAEITRPVVREGSPKIVAEATLAGREMKFLLDTGAPGSVSLFGPASRKTGLWDADIPHAPVRPFGIGGAAAIGRLVRGDVLAIGDLRFERPLVQLHDPGERINGDFDGIIGLDILQRMNLSTDVRKRALWAQPNRQPRFDERYGLSGLWVDRDDDVAVVKAVGRHSPAAAAGLAVGDRIVGMSFPQIVRSLSSGPGSVLPIRYTRDGQPGSTEIRFRPFL